jgi:hypothetical protein
MHQYHSDDDSKVYMCGCDGRSGLGAGLVFGLLVLAAGVLFALEAFDVLEPGTVWQYWPVALIVLGVAQLILPGACKSGGVILIIIGVAFQFDIGWRYIWPILLVLLGALIIWRSFFGGRMLRAASQTAGSRLNETVALGGKEVKSQSPDFRGGSITAILGGIDLDLRQAGTAKEGAVLDVFAMMGGIEIRVPEDWEVTSQVFPMMGAFEDKRSSPRLGDQAAPKGHLVIRGTVFMGGVEVKS